MPAAAAYLPPLGYPIISPCRHNAISFPQSTTIAGSQKIHTEAKLTEMGLKLPSPGVPKGNFAMAVKSGKMIYLCEWKKEKRGSGSDAIIVTHINEDEKVYYVGQPSSSNSTFSFLPLCSRPPPYGREWTAPHRKSWRRGLPRGSSGCRQIDCPQPAFFSEKGGRGSGPSTSTFSLFSDGLFFSRAPSHALTLACTLMSTSMKLLNVLERSTHIFIPHFYGL